jgi:hypothetical protein
MRSLLIAGVLAFGLAPATSQAQDYLPGRSVVTGAAIGAGVGAVVGTIVGVAVGGPRLPPWLRSGRHQECWYDRAGMRQCRFY